MKTHTSLKLLLLSMILLLSSCSSDDDSNPVLTESSAKQIVNFTFLASNNTGLAEDVTAQISEENKTITATLPFGPDSATLTPSLEISDKATVSPNSSEPQNFTNPVTYTVTAEDGSTREYTVQITIDPNTAKEILSFKFLKDNNSELPEDIEAEINQQEKTIIAYVPPDTDFMLTPAITISEKATIAITTTDFTAPTVSYTVTAEDGSTQEYQISVIMKFPSDRQVLERLYKINPENRLEWDLMLPIENWEGVSLDATSENVTTLLLEDKNITLLPREIGELSNLKQLFLGKNSLTSLPTEIGKLTLMAVLAVNNNTLTSIPDQIETLDNLLILSLSNNLLASIPEAIGDLDNLDSLSLANNSLTSLPSEIGMLTTLTNLFIKNNPGLTGIPQEICDMEANYGTIISMNEGVICQ